MDSRRPTLEDVARAAGVSRGAASRVVNRQRGVRPDVRLRVEQVIADLGFRPHSAARALASGHPEAIELLIIDADRDAFATNPFYARVVAGMARATDGFLAVRVVESPKAAWMALDNGRPLGRVLVNVPSELAAAIGAHGPAVSLGSSALSVPCVGQDNVDGARQAVRHLRATGRRSVAAVLGPQSNPCAVRRRIGYLEAVRDAGQAPIVADGDFSLATARVATHQLLREHPEIDAIFAACDVTAMGVMQVVAECGRRVPDDVAVVGFDDSVLAVAATPPLSSVHQSIEEEGELAVSILLNQPTRARVDPPYLVVRESSRG